MTREAILYEKRPNGKFLCTACAGCNEIVVKRFGFDIQEWHLDQNNKCKFCGNQIPITGSLAKDYKQERFQFIV